MMDDISGGFGPGGHVEDIVSPHRRGVVLSHGLGVFERYEFVRVKWDDDGTEERIENPAARLRHSDKRPGAVMLTDEEAQAIKARLEATTPGEWLHDSGEDDLSDIGLIWCEGEIVADTGTSDRPDANAQFIVHARTDISALLAERAALLEIVRVVATLKDEWFGNDDVGGWAYATEDVTPLVEQARALLAGKGGTQS